MSKKKIKDLTLEELVNFDCKNITCGNCPFYKRPPFYKRANCTIANLEDLSKLDLEKEVKVNE